MLNILSVSSITKSFGGLEAVNVENFQINSNEITSLIGPNGAGKTTFFDLITRFQDADSGSIFFKNKNVLVTGGTGLIGRPLIDYLIGFNAKVTTVSLDSPDNLPREVIFIKSDLRNLKSCLEVAEDKDIVFHLAGVKGSPAMTAQKPASFFVPTITFNRNMMEASLRQGVKSYLYTSSIGVYSPSEVFRRYGSENEKNSGFTLAQKMVGKACGMPGVRAGEYCEPRMTTVGSQDTTGPMTRDELKELACLGFSSDLVMQSFCHTAAYPKPVDLDTHRTLPDFFINRGGVSLRPGDGIIHSWLNRMLLPDTVGTGGDSHTRFPIGISFPAGSGMVAFAATLGVMPLEMPESVLVKFSGDLQPGITIRDLVHAIPYYALKNGLLTLDKKTKKNIFSGRCLEIEGLPNLKIEQAFELSDASAERSSSGCTVKLDEEPIIEYLKSNITLLRWMISEGYSDAKTLERRARAMEKWIENPVLMSADKDAEYAAVIDIPLEEINEPLLCCPNDPDDVKKLGDVAGDKVDEGFIGSCMTNIGHFRAAGKLLERHGKAKSKLWIVPPTRMDEHQLTAEGYYDIFKDSQAQVEIPGCSLCMGNQARVLAGATVLSTSTRNFPNRLGDGANVYLTSAELASVGGILGRLPTRDEYFSYAKKIDSMASEIYKYMNFDQIASFQDAAKKADTIVSQEIVELV